MTELKFFYVNFTHKSGRRRFLRLCFGAVLDRVDMFNIPYTNQVTIAGNAEKLIKTHKLFKSDPSESSMEPNYPKDNCFFLQGHVQNSQALYKDYRKLQSTGSIPTCKLIYFAISIPFPTRKLR